MDEVFTPTPPPTKPDDVYEFNGSDDGTRAVTLYYLFVYFIFNAITLVSEFQSTPQALRTRTDAPAAPSVSPLFKGPIASGTSQDQDEEDDDDERLLRPKRLTVVEKFASSTDTQVRLVHLFESQSLLTIRPCSVAREILPDV